MSADTSKTYHADDYRLSSYGAFTLGARWSVALSDQWTLELEAERYETSQSWGLYSGEEAPALVDFWRGTIALIWRFE